MKVFSREFKGRPGAVLASACAAVSLAFNSPAVEPAPSGSLVAYVGTYTGAKSKGIYLYRFDARSGALSPLGLAAATPSPSFVVISPDHRFLYAANETGSFRGKKTGSVTSFAINPATGALTELNAESSGGSGPCHLSTDRSGRHVFVANYGSGSIEVLPVGEDGHLGQPTCFIQDEGKGSNPQRQEGPHAHFILPDPAGRRVLAVDLGLDKIFIYRFDPSTGLLKANRNPFVRLPDGVGPRHFVFSTNGRRLYVVNEMGSSITTFKYNLSTAATESMGSVSTLPPGFKGDNTCAEIQIHPNGRFVYASNRGDDSIAAFAISKKDGSLIPLGQDSTRGKAPRHFVIDPTGTWLVAANQSSDNLAVFRINPEEGRLTPQGEVVPAGSPVCVQFLALP